MNVEDRELECMLIMQQTDLKRLQAEKKLHDLPQRGKIVALRQKRATILEKKEKIDAMLAEAKLKVRRVSDEDELLSQKAASVQAAIDNARGDYRNVESRTKELQGISKRRATLSEELDAYAEELEKATELSSQVEDALVQLDVAEKSLIASFQKEGGQLQDEIARCKAEHEHFASTLCDETRNLYEKTASKCGGVAIGRLEEGGKCSICRSVLDDAHVVALRAERPLGTCPSCRRLIIVS